VERHVDLWMKRRSVHSIAVVPAETTEAPVPRGTGASRPMPGQRQRMDMTRPITMAPKPIAKFHAPSDTINGMRSPAT
jgi:hypothetical protein